MRIGWPSMFGALRRSVINLIILKIIPIFQEKLLVDHFSYSFKFNIVLNLLVFESDFPCVLIMAVLIVVIALCGYI